MTGLNLESFLHLLRADLGAWALLGLVACVIMVMVWTSWGSRRALRKCLVLSITAHLGLALYGSTFLFLLLALQPKGAEEQARRRESGRSGSRPGPTRKPTPTAREAEQRSGGNRPGTRLMPWDRPRETLVLAESHVDPPRPAVPAPEALAPLQVPASPALPAATAAPESKPPAPAAPESRPEPAVAAELVDAPRTGRAGRPGRGRRAGRRLPEHGRARARRPAPGRGERLRPARDPASAPQPENGRPLPAPGPLIAPDLAPPLAVAADPLGTGRSVEPDGGTSAAAHRDACGGRAGRPACRDVKSSSRSPRPRRPSQRCPRPRCASVPGRRPGPTPPTELGVLRRASEPAGPIALTRVIPGSTPRLPEVQGTSGGRRWSEVPAVYRSRLDPNRSELAQRAGASPASEQAVERALDWLARHQDSDGRWDGSTARYDDGSPVKGDDDYTIHCPPGEPCFGECIYWEADTALDRPGTPGLPRLGLHAGRRQVLRDGRERGRLPALAAEARRRPARPEPGRRHVLPRDGHPGTLRGLRPDRRRAAPRPGRAGRHVSDRRTRQDGMAWRYDRGFSTGDTSILGWVVMALKSAKVVGIPGPDTVREGTLAWLKKVAAGPALGLGKYQPNDPITPTMTAEAWVCRQFLGVGGPGPASTEAADYLLAHGPNRDPYNLYYWYYGTLAMYQHGGDAWSRWNAAVRDQLVQRQRNSGHIAGSWDPDDSLYGAKGGRIYCTALATLTLEVYYRFLRLYDDPKLPASPTTTLPRRINDPAAALRPSTGSTP